MPEGIESFVKKLQDEGVNAGKEAAEKIKNDANREADNMIADAKAETVARYGCNMCLKALSTWY
jgi:vacuolar-type H+-ATPase subunit H